MSVATVDITGRARRVIVAQVVASAVLGIGALIAFGALHGVSVVYGGMVGMLLTLLLSRSVRRAEQVATSDPKAGMTVLYVGAVQRFVVFLVVFAVGLAVLDLNPLAVAVGFIATQFAQLINARGVSRDDEGERK